MKFNKPHSEIKKAETSHKQQETASEQENVTPSSVAHSEPKKPETEEQAPPPRDYKKYARYIAWPFKAAWKFLTTHHEFISAVATLAIAVLTCYYVKYAKKQWEEMQKSTIATQNSADAAGRSADEAKRANTFARDSLIRVQRAFVVIDPTPDIQPFQGEDGKRYYIFYFHLENTGTTPTRNLKAYMNWMNDTKPMLANYSYPDRNEKGQPITRADTISIVPVLGPKNRSPLSPGRIPIETIQQVRSGERYVYIYGWATYNDIFENSPRHVTKFSFEVIAPKGIIPDAQGRAAEGIQIRTAGTRHNCYDEECKEP